MRTMEDNQVHEKFYHEIFETLREEPYANHLGIELKSLGKGSAAATLTVQEHMLNTHGTVHGAVIFAIADYVFAAASNSYGKTSVGITTTMNFMAPAQKGEQLKAEAKEEKRTHKLAWYRIHVTSGESLVAVMDATVYRKNEYFVPIEEMKDGAGLKK
ncbi:hotdog fold thioesterase [Siminovitchia sp. 179-K 8D1 HS]|uniref:hotdog fold thioesterase n=1 Tax=Siminovitchia sp. 179-K 8D1 HS TaxID=3142385 RepID=UPI00399FA582